LSRLTRCFFFNPSLTLRPCRSYSFHIFRTEPSSRRVHRLSSVPDTILPWLLWFLPPSTMQRLLHAIPGYFFLCGLRYYTFPVYHTNVITRGQFQLPPKMSSEGYRLFCLAIPSWSFNSRASCLILRIPLRVLVGPSNHPFPGPWLASRYVTLFLPFRTTRLSRVIFPFFRLHGVLAARTEYFSGPGGRQVRFLIVVLDPQIAKKRSSRSFPLVFLFFSFSSPLPLFSLFPPPPPFFPLSFYSLILSSSFLPPSLSASSSSLFFPFLSFPFSPSSPPFSFPPVPPFFSHPPHPSPPPELSGLRSRHMSDG